MSQSRTYTAAEVEAWQPRARHYYHQAGQWHGPSYIAWIDQQIQAFCTEKGLTLDDRARHHQDEFTAWIEARCQCAGDRS